MTKKLSFINLWICVSTYSSNVAMFFTKGGLLVCNVTDTSKVVEPAAKKKKMSFKIDSTAAKHIKDDVVNKRLWDEAMKCTVDGLQVSNLKKVLLLFCLSRICYQEHLAGVL